MKIIGYPKVIAELRAKKKGIDKQIDDITQANAIEMAGDATKRAPEAFGKLKQSIDYSRVVFLKWKTTVNKEYAGFMEFGTGTKVQVPAEFSDMAKSFQSGGKGNFKQALENIKLWCKKKGIDEKAAYPILLSILRVGVNPQPFFYPAWVSTKKRYVKDLENLLKTLNKK